MLRGEQMKQMETEHYVFHYQENSKAEQDIAQIADCQEACFRYICDVLHTYPDFRIRYFLCDSPEEVGRIYGDDEPCNGFASPPDTIYAVYNEKVRCIGFHEDAHLISYTLNRPDSPAIREGLAMYFDRRWWGIHNLDWVVFYLKNGQYVPVESLLDTETFFDTDCAVSYPIVGAFTDYLIATYGQTAYIDFYSRKDSIQAFREIYHQTPAELERAFVAYVRLFGLDSAVESRISQLIHS